MKLIWHLVKKDLVRERWALVAWLALFAAQIGDGVALRAGVFGANHGGGIGYFVSVVLVFLQAAVTYLLVARWVQADGLVGTRMFWATRPISRLTLLKAKAAGILAVFAAAPVLVLLPWWLACGFDGRETAWAAVEAFGWQVAVLLPALALAAMTDSSSRLLLWTIVGVLGVIVGLLFQSVAGGKSDLIATRMVVAGAVAAVVMAMVIVNQFLTRRFVVSLTIALAGVVLVAVIGRTWHWSAKNGLGGGTMVRPTTGEAEWVKAVAVEFSGARLKDTTLTMRLLARGLPTGGRLEVAKSRQIWRWPGGLTVERENLLGGTWEPQDLRGVLGLKAKAPDQETAAYLEKRHAQRRDERWDAEGGLFSWVNLAPSVAARLRREPPAYEATMDAVLVQARIAAELPLRNGAQSDQGFADVKIAEVERTGHRTQVKLATVLSPHRGAGPGLWRTFTRSQEWRRRAWTYVVNRTTGDFEQVGYAEAFTGMPQVAGVKIGWSTLFVQGPKVRRGDAWTPPDERWTEGASLVLTDEKELGRLSLEVKAERVVAQ